MKKKIRFVEVMLIILVLLVAIVAVYLCFDPFHNRSFHEENFEQDNIYNDMGTEVENISDETQEDVISITPQLCYGHEPNLEYLTEAADLIVSGIVDTSSFNYNVQNTFIYTNMNIQVTKVLKNNTESNLSGSLNIQIMGGKLSAKDYISSLDDSYKSNYSLSEEELEKYSFSLDTSNGKLNLQEENVEYLFFLNNMYGNWGPNSNHYGIRKIDGNKVYDYETDAYIETDLL